MPTLLLLILSLFLSFWICDSIVVQSFFYGIEWTSRIPKVNLISGDTLAIREIALHANNQIINIVPTVTGFQDPGDLTDDSYAQSTYPIEYTFSVKWEFNGQLLPIDYIKIVTNCGDRNPSLFCKNSTFIFNTSNKREAMTEVPLIANIQNIKLLQYENGCRQNTLILDTQRSIDTICQYQCEECLKYLSVNLTSYTMDTLSTISSSSTTSSCQCPSFQLKVEQNNILQVWDKGNMAGSLVRGSNLERVQMTWHYWMGQEVTWCKQLYLPNIEDFMTIPAYKALSLIFTFNHSNGPLYYDREENKTQIQLFELEVEEYLNDLLNLSWVFIVQLYSTWNKTDKYSYDIYVESNEQKTSLNVLELQSIYNISRDVMADGIIDLISDHFNTNRTTGIEGFTWSQDVILRDNNTCHTYFQTTTESPVYIVPSKDSKVALVISLVSIAVGLLITAILLLICYNRHLACFKQKWDVKDTANKEGVDVTDPKYIYQGQKQIGKKNENIVAITKGNGCTDPTKIVNVPYHLKQESIRIVNVKSDNYHTPTPDIAKLRAKSLSTDDAQKKESVVIIADLKDPNNPNKRVKIQKNVSERVLPEVLPTGGLRKIQQSLKARDSAQSEYTQNPVDEVYVSTESTSVPPKHGTLKASYDYGRNSNRSNRSDKSNYSNYGYNKVAQYSSSPETTPKSSDNHDIYYDGKEIQLETIADDKPSHHPAPESKIDDALNIAKRSNKVIEFTDFDHELKLIKIIGEGSFGKVYKAKWDAEFVAVKIFTNINPTSISTNKMDVASTQLSVGNGTNGSSSHGLAVEQLEIKSIDDEQYKELYAEIVLATSIPPHPNIVRINGFCRKPLCVVMEYMAGGSVQKLVYGLTNKPTPSVMEKFVILVKACYGLAKLTEYGLHHRDVAARNILLGEYSTAIDSNTKVKITDFGMTRKDNDDHSGIQKTKNDGGPYKWMAPESIQKQIYNEKTDVYMFGITIWEIMYGREPYENVDAINAAMSVCMKQERPEFLWDLPSGLKTLIKKCWDLDPENRPKFKDVAHKLQRLQSNVQSDIQENKEIDENVEKFNKEKEEKEQQYANITNINQEQQYDEFD